MGSPAADALFAIVSSLQSGSLFCAAMDATEDAFLFYDSGKRVAWCSRQATRLFGAEGNELVGLTLHDLLRRFATPKGAPLDYDELPAVIAFQTQKAAHNTCLMMKRADGDVRTIKISAQPLISEMDGSVQGVLTCMKDITQRSRVEEALRESEERWQLAVRGSTDGIWDLDLQTGSIYLSDRSRSILCIEKGRQVCGIDDLRHCMVEADAALFFGDLSAHVAGLTDIFSCEFRVTDATGQPLWVLARAMADRDNAGAARRLAGSFTDIRERKESEERLVAANTRFEALIRDLKMGVLVEDSNRQVVLVNQAFCDLMLIDSLPEALLGANCARTFEDSKCLFRSPDEYIARISDILLAQAPVNGEEISLADGRVFERDYVPVFLTDEYGGHYWMYRDISERKRYELNIRQYNSALEMQRHELEHANGLLATLATTDSLTGVRNRRAFEDRLRLEFTRCRRHDFDLSLIMLDVDNFKLYNDTYGHMEGDLVLKTLADILVRHSREYDLVARYGGEEFVVILPETDADRAMMIAERFRDMVQGAPWEKRLITASFGVAQLSRCCPDPSVVLAQADEALYQSKRNGRNRVTLADVDDCADSQSETRLDPAAELIDPNR